MSEPRRMRDAPYDGTPILLAYELHSNDLHGYVPWKEIHWVIGWWDAPDGWKMCFMEDGCADTHGNSFQFFMDVKPKAWMPLPEPLKKPR